MKARFAFGVIASLLIATIAWAAIKLNSSKCNVYRLTYPSDLVSRDQAKAILAELLPGNRNRLSAAVGVILNGAGLAYVSQYLLVGL